MKYSNPLLVAFFALGISLVSVAVNASRSEALETQSTLNVLTIQTDSVMGDEVARIFSQIIYTKQYSVLSSLSIREITPTSSTREILLETPLRSITSHRFSSMQPRLWENPQRVAEHFLQVAEHEGILVSFASDQSN